MGQPTYVGFPMRGAGWERILATNADTGARAGRGLGAWSAMWSIAAIGATFGREIKFGANCIHRVFLHTCHRWLSYVQSTRSNCACWRQKSSRREKQLKPHADVQENIIAVRLDYIDPIRDNYP
jgi:hypothetical protein